MKKIVSLLCAFVMVLSVASISAYAYDFVGEVNLEFDRIEDGAAYYKAVLTVSDDAEDVFLTSYKAIYNLAPLYNGTGLTSADVSSVAVDSAHSCKISSGKINFTYTSSDGVLPDDGVLGYIKIANIANLTSNVDIAPVTGYKFIAVVDGVANKTVTSNFTVKGVTVETLGEPAPSDPVKEYGYGATVEAALGWENYDGSFTDKQVGLGFKFDGTIPEGATAMKWIATIGGNRVYSPVAIEISEFGVETGSPVVIYSTYIYEANHGGLTAEKIAALEDASAALNAGACFSTPTGYVTTEAAE